MYNVKKADVLLGLQWGDEGKGKIVDFITPDYQVVARFQGGPNAGHTLEFENKKVVLHTIPSGIFRKDCINIVGNGVVVDPFVFETELAETGLDFDYVKQRLLISSGAHIILPTHRLLDAAYERTKGAEKIGSTLKGIGPTYTDKAGRTGLRISDLSSPKFDQKYNLAKQAHLKLVEMLGFEPNDFEIEALYFDEYEKRWLKSLESLVKFEVIDSPLYLNQALDAGQKVLAEGAQGTLLDIDFGSYPFVTSSNTVAAGACTGLGLAPSRIGDVIGIFKAYCTRVGSGPFSTELFDSNGEMLRRVGNEFGATTGRPRRCGWLDLCALKYATMINGVTKLVITKADVLGAFPSIKVCTGYSLHGKTVDFSTSSLNPDEVEPQLKEFKGWKSNLENIFSFGELPVELLDYIKYIEDFVSVPVVIVSTGPGRKQTITRE